MTKYGKMLRAGVLGLTITLGGTFFYSPNVSYAAPGETWQDGYSGYQAGCLLWSLFTKHECG
ncbi:hypothetical protein AB9M93_12370 [Peribacillus frigoritolerans]|uniref:hypothetical protein n=1 Tax=Peribacillus frigoritolerans TaxID=450367 RepID=UPI003518C4EE